MENCTVLAGPTSPANIEEVRFLVGASVVAAVAAVASIPFFTAFH
jgi:hypothetical protein